MIFAGPYYIVAGEKFRYPIKKEALKLPATFDPAPLDYGIIAPSGSYVTSPIAVEATDFVWLVSPRSLRRVVIANGKRTVYPTEKLRELVEPSKPVSPAFTWIPSPELQRVYPRTVYAQLPGRLPGVRDAVYTALSAVYGHYDAATRRMHGVYPMTDEGRIWVTVLRCVDGRSVGLTFEVEIPECIEAADAPSGYSDQDDLVRDTISWIDSHEIVSGTA